MAPENQKKEKSPGPPTKPRIANPQTEDELDHCVLAAVGFESNLFFDAFADSEILGLPLVRLGSVFVRWRPTELRVKPRYVVYEGEITSTISGETKLSLYNICLQGRLFEVTILDAKAGDGNPVYFRKSGLAWSEFTNQLTIGNARKDAPKPNDNNPADKSEIWGIKFTGRKCTLQILSRRRIHADKSIWFNSHDTTPPPNPPGGQDGEA